MRHRVPTDKLDLLQIGQPVHGDGNGGLADRAIKREGLNCVQVTRAYCVRLIRLMPLKKDQKTAICAHFGGPAKRQSAPIYSTNVQTDTCLRVTHATDAPIRRTILIWFRLMCEKSRIEPLRWGRCRFFFCLKRRQNVFSECGGQLICANQISMHTRCRLADPILMPIDSDSFTSFDAMQWRQHAAVGDETRDGTE